MTALSEPLQPHLLPNSNYETTEEDYSICCKIDSRLPQNVGKHGIYSVSAASVWESVRLGKQILLQFMVFPLSWHLVGLS